MELLVGITENLIWSILCITFDFFSPKQEVGTHSTKKNWYGE